MAHSLLTSTAKQKIRQSGEASSAVVHERPSSSDILATILLPAYNEEDALATVLEDLFAIVDDSFEVMVVDDGSHDATAAIAARYPCRLIRHQTNHGKGQAVRTGLNHARGRFVILMDADATYPVDAIPGIVDLLQHNDLVRCVRDGGREHMPLTNRLGNWLFDRLLAILCRLDGADYLSGLYGLRRDVLLDMDLEAEGFDLEVEIGMKARSRGLRTAIMPIHYRERMGEKKLDAWRDGWVILSRVLYLFLVYNPVLTFIVPGLAIMTIATIGAVTLSTSSLVTPYFGLDVHSFILAALGTLAGFQLVTFGLAAALYGVQTGCPPRPWLVWASSARVRLGSAVLGLLLSMCGAIWLVSMGSGWLARGGGNFEGTREIVIAATLLVGGLQLLSAALFISIFAGRLQQAVNGASPVVTFERATTA
jgi:hypothetical protein